MQTTVVYTASSWFFPFAGGPKLWITASFQVHADQRPSSPLDVAVTLLGEPVQVELAPMTLHGTLRSIQDAVNAWRRGGIGDAHLSRMTTKGPQFTIIHQVAT